MSSSGSVRCRVLGPARVLIGGADAPQEVLWRKHLALLVYLARSPRGRTREHLLGLLWSEKEERQARHSLSEALGVLRRALGDAAVRADVDQVRLEPGGVVLDADLFAERAARGDWAGAAALVEGEFLEGLSIPGANEFETWLAAERAHWRSQGLDVLMKHAAALLAAGDASSAAQVSRRALALDSTSEAAAREAMRALALAGDRPGALRVADAFVQTLTERLGAAPAPETLRLIERIREARVGRRVSAPPPEGRPRPPLIGRSAELGALTAAWDSARAGRGQLVLIEGEPGEGKSRLMDELVARARLDDATVVSARAVPADRDASWSAVRGLLAGGLADAPGLTGASPAALAVLRRLDAGDDPLGGAGAVAPPIAQAVSAAVLAAAAERPVLLAFDDAQWIDGETLALLPALARDTARRPVLLALGVARGVAEGTRCDELRARLERDLEGAVVRVGRFDETALRSLVAWALPDYDAEDADRVVRRLERDTAGIPLLAVAMLQAVAQGFRLAQEAPAWPAPQRTLVDSLPGELPPAVVGTICLRFRGLPLEAQQVLGAAAVLGERVERDTLVRATGLDPGAVDEALDLLEWERWVASDARGYAFGAPIVRGILLQEMIPAGQARRWRAGLSGVPGGSVRG